MAQPNSKVQPKPGISVWKIIRWTILGVALFLLLLIFRKPPMVAERLPADEVKEKAEEFQSKLKMLSEARERGQADTVHLSSDEINAALQQGLAEQMASKGEKTQPSATAEIPELPEGMRATQVVLEGDHATVQTPAYVLGRAVYVTVTAKVGVQDGYMTFEFGDGRIGSLSVPASVLNREMQRRLRAADIRDKLKLPDYVTDLRIENGQLVLSVR